MEVIDAAATKPYGFMPFYPGPGVGGHCIPCDPHYLLWQLRKPAGLRPADRAAMTGIAGGRGGSSSACREMLREPGTASPGPGC